jgi:acetyltransferase-like isoleucine patch superfamily enzyme
MANNYMSVIHPKSVIGNNVRIYDFVNIYGPVEIGEGSVIGAFVEIQPGVKIGKNVKVSSHSFICTGVTIEDDVFLGHGVMFINDKFPKAVSENGSPINASDTNVIPTVIKKGASLGTGSIIMCGITIGSGAMVGAGSLVLKDVDSFHVVVGNPAKYLRNLNNEVN